MPSQEPFSKHEKLLHYVAHRVLRRCHAAGARTVQMEDIFGELCIAWCLARDSWKPEHQVPFGAFLMKGMSNHINRWVEKETRQHNLAPFELDADLSAMYPGSGNVRTMHDIVGDEKIAQPDAALEEKDMRDYARDPLRWRRGLRKHKPLTKNAAVFLELLENPPPALVKIIKGLQDRAAYGRATLKIPSTFAPKRISGALILDLMGIEDRVERASIYSQLEHLGERISQL